MPDTRTHRGPHPEDVELFAPGIESLLRAATDDFCWLLNRGYAADSALKLVGDRYALRQRQRTAVGRCACTQEAASRRQRHRIESSCVQGEELWIDGYNVLTTLEAALGGGVLLKARDGCFRDMASMHGSYRKVAETIPAILLVGESASVWGAVRLRWLLDSPVSNSGRLKKMLLTAADQSGWDWSVELVPNPDIVLSATSQIVVTADSAILDRCERWLNLARLVISERVPGARVVDLSGSSQPQSQE